MGSWSKPTHTRPRRAPARRDKPPRTLIPCAVVLLLALAGGLWFGLTRFPPKPLLVDTAGLDPAIAGLIDETIHEVRASPRSGDAWGKLGSVLLHYDFQPQAQFAFEQAERFSPADPRWPYLHGMLFIDDHSEIVRTNLETAVALCQDQTDMPRLRLAQLLLEDGQLDRAIIHYQALLQRQPKHPLALLGLAHIRLAEGRPSECTHLLRDCLTDPFTAKRAHALWAQANQQLGRTTAAQIAARQTAQLPADLHWPDPYYSETLPYRVGKRARIEEAGSLLDQGCLAAAFKILTAVTNDYPEDEETWYSLGWILNQEQRGPEAERVLREHLRLSPHSPKGHAQLARALLIQGRHADAVPVLQRAIQLKPTGSDLHFNLGYACVHLGQNDAAIAHFQNAIRNRPDYVDAYILCADLLNRRGDMDEAIHFLRRALELSPTDQRAASLLHQIQPKH